jgi:hypothetical protein
MRYILFLLLISLGTAAWSQQEGPLGPFVDPDNLAGEEEEELRRYSVEVIVFEYAEGAYDGEELYTPLPPPEPPPEPVLEYIELPDYRTLRTVEENYEDEDIEEIQLHGLAEILLMQPEQLTMTDIFERLDRLDAYQPVLHGGWTQNTIERELARPIRLRAIGDPPLRLDGTLTLYLSRYLHLIVDLGLEAEGQPGEVAANADEAIVYYGDARNDDNYDYFDDVGPLPSTVRYDIFDDRIFRNGEVRYFDHPKFGVIAKVTRFEKQELEESEAPLETDEAVLLPAITPGN